MPRQIALPHRGFNPPPPSHDHHQLHPGGGGVQYGQGIHHHGNGPTTHPSRQPYIIDAAARSLSNLADAATDVSSHHTATTARHFPPPPAHVPPSHTQQGGGGFPLPPNPTQEYHQNNAAGEGLNFQDAVINGGGVKESAESADDNNSGEFILRSTVYLDGVIYIRWGEERERRNL